jgi:cytochrome b6-f complex iron-sulfur subunit
MDRRQFLGWIGIGMLANSLPVVIAACTDTGTDTGQGPDTGTGGGSTPTPPPKIDTAVRPDGFQALGSVKELEAKGQLLDEQNAAQPVLIFRNPDTKQIAAVNPTCPHKGCLTLWQPDLKIFACPCHGSKFDPTGKVVTAPSTAPLKNFVTKQEGDSILVKVV